MPSKSKEAVANGGNIFYRRSPTRPIDDGMGTDAKQKWPTKPLPNLLNGFLTEPSAFTHRISISWKKDISGGL